MSARAQSRRVLDYLQDMMDVCRQLHRHDLLSEYQDAWEVSAVAIYGALPPRVANVGHYAAVYPPHSEPPAWRTAIVARPYRKIVRREGQDEVLECGHRHWLAVQIPGNPAARRRRCAECAQQNSPAQNAGTRTAADKDRAAVVLPGLIVAARKKNEAGGKRQTASTTPAQKKPPARAIGPRAGKQEVLSVV